MRQTKEHKEAYISPKNLFGVLDMRDSDGNSQLIPLADITVNEDGSTTITPVSETKSTHMKRIEPIV